MSKRQPLLKLTVEGFKSVSDAQSLDIAPLTILAGANSSGKSSMMQTLLLLKQTLEANYDPGALLLSGPNVKFSRISQMLSDPDGGFSVGIAEEDKPSAMVRFESAGKSIRLAEMRTVLKDRPTVLRPDMTHSELLAALPAAARKQISPLLKTGSSRVCVGDLR